jgi:hypothetical protein
MGSRVRARRSWRAKRRRPSTHPPRTECREGESGKKRRQSRTRLRPAPDRAIPSTLGFRRLVIPHHVWRVLLQFLRVDPFVGGGRVPKPSDFVLKSSAHHSIRHHLLHLPLRIRRVGGADNGWRVREGEGRESRRVGREVGAKFRRMDPRVNREMRGEVEGVRRGGVVCRRDRVRSDKLGQELACQARRESELRRRDVGF